jgi:L-amino acid N-acyltransferase YncA
MTTADYEIDLATKADIPGILQLQEQNLLSRGGMLTVAFPHAWFEAAVADMPLIIAHREGRIIAYLVSASFAALGHLPIIQAQQRAYPASEGAYNYGPICVAQNERERGLAGKLFARLRAQLPGREAITFIRRDNAASITAHLKMGMLEVAGFTFGNVDYAVLAFRP